MVNPIVDINIATYPGMSVQLLNTKKEKHTPLNVTGLIQGKMFPRSAPSTGFPIKAPKEANAKAIPNRTLIIHTSASERTYKR